MFSDLLSPDFLSVAQEPLVAKGDDTWFTSTRGDFFLWLIVWDRGAFIIHLFSDDRLGVFDPLALSDTDLHDTLREALLVALILGLLKLDCVFVGLDFHLFNCSFGAEVAHSWHINEWNGVVSLDPFEFNSHDLSEALLLLEVDEHGVIIWCI